MKGRGHRRDYGWTHAQDDLAMGVHPAVVAARLGENEEYVREVAEERGWPITHRGVTQEQILDAFKWTDA